MQRLVVVFFFWLVSVRAKKGNPKMKQNISKIKIVNILSEEQFRYKINNGEIRVKINRDLRPYQWQVRRHAKPIFKAIIHHKYIFFFVAVVDFEPTRPICTNLHIKSIFIY